MDIQYLGANCLKIITKNATVFVDPAVPGVKIDTKKARFEMLTNKGLLEHKTDNFLIDTPGEYEIGGLSVHGVPARAHMDGPDTHKATIYKITHDNFNIVVTGHIFPKLSDEQLEEIGMVDILAVPVGGNGYTVDSTGAAELIRQIEPKVVLPVHFADKDIKYEVPQAELKVFLDEIGAHPEEMDSYKTGKNTILPDQLQLVVLNRTK